MRLAKDPKSTIGGLIALLSVFGLLTHRIDITTALTVLGIAAGWIGITAKDSDSPAAPTTVTTAVTDSAGAKTTAVTTTTETS